MPPRRKSSAKITQFINNPKSSALSHNPNHGSPPTSLKVQKSKQKLLAKVQKKLRKNESDITKWTTEPTEPIISSNQSPTTHVPIESTVFGIVPRLKLDILPNQSELTPPVRSRLDNCCDDNIGNVKLKAASRVPVDKFSKAEIAARLKLFDETKNKIIGIEPIVHHDLEETSNEKISSEDEKSGVAKDYKSIKLPIFYDALLEAFKYMDRSLAMFHNCGKQCFFQNLKQVLSSNSLQLHFNLKLFMQILEIAQQMFIVTKTKVAKYGINLDCQYDYLIKFGSCNSYKLSSDSKSKHYELMEKIKSSHLIYRSDLFRSKLLNLAHENHFKFLRNIYGPDVTLPDPSTINRFHPKFESQPIDDLPQIELEPLYDEVESQKFNSTLNASAIIDETEQEITSLVNSSIQNIVLHSPVKSESYAETKNSNGANDGIGESLLQRIREKECRKNVENMLLSNDALKLKQLESKLESFIHLVDYLHKTEKRSTLLLTNVAQKASSSIKVDYPLEFNELLELALKKFPKYLNLVSRKNVQYLTIDPKIDVSTMILLLKN